PRASSRTRSLPPCRSAKAGPSPASPTGARAPRPRSSLRPRRSSRRSAQATDRLEVALLRLLHDAGRQRRRGWLVVPTARVEPVAYDLFVEALEPALLVARAVPVARRVGRQRLVDQRERSVDAAELELGVGQHQPARPCVRAGLFVERE